MTIGGTETIGGTKTTGGTETTGVTKPTGVTDSTGVTPKGKKQELDGSAGSSGVPAAKEYVYHIASVIKV